MYLKFHKTLFICLLGIIQHSFAQKNVKKDYHFNLIHEISVGKIVPNHLDYPKSGIKTGYSVNFLWNNKDSTDAVYQYYKNPQFGFQIGLHRLGNPALFGNQVDVLPVLNLPTKKGSFQFGLGLSYFTKTYINNSENLAIGSRFNWSFQSIYYRNFNFSESKDLRIGFGYHHASNGHTQLPNYGLNSAVVLLSLIDKREAYNIFQPSSTSSPTTSYFKLSTGMGYHEFGGTTKPVGGPKKAVYNISSQIGFQFKGQFRWYAGFGARKYQHYEDSLRRNPELRALNVTANNYYFITGIEYLIYHVGISIDGGINIYKPFYDHFSRRYETTDGWQYETKKLFLSRVGIRFYLFDTSKKPKHNVYIAPYLNANFGQADFTELSFGYVLKLKN